MFVLKSDKALFVDCDNTLIIWEKNGHSFHIHKNHVELVKRFHARGQAVVVWSAGGYEWALSVVKMCELEAYVSAVMSKPAWYADDSKAEDFLPEVNRIFLPESEEASYSLDVLVASK